MLLPVPANVLCTICLRSTTNQNVSRRLPKIHTYLSLLSLHLDVVHSLPLVGFYLGPEGVWGLAEARRCCPE